LTTEGLIVLANSTNKLAGKGSLNFNVGGVDFSDGADRAKFAVKKIVKLKMSFFISSFFLFSEKIII
jgi:hypothetical protein